MNPDDKPLIVQGDGSLFLDIHSKFSEKCRGEISAYADLEKSPEHIHTYRICSLSLWNAAGAGWSVAQVTDSLTRWSRYPVPDNIIRQIEEILSRWGQLRLLPADETSRGDLHLVVDDAIITEELRSRKRLSKWLIPEGKGFRVSMVHRGTVKAELIRLGFPVVDLTPLKTGDPMDIELRTECADGRPLLIRDYQADAVRAFMGNGKAGTGFGAVVMPCGSGKTVVGIAVMAEMKVKTLIITTNTAAVHQWRDELLDKTSLNHQDIGEYTGDRKFVAPVTVATYQIITWSKGKKTVYPHFDLFRQHGWGLIIYDEVHLLPAPVFRVTAEIQAIHRLGLTATLIREDGAERDLFSLVGPKRYDVPWKELESSGWIAEAQCREIRIDLPTDLRIPYAMADKRRKVRLAAENPRKREVAMQLVKNHREDQILIIGQYIAQLEDIAGKLSVPLITGKTPNAEREHIYDDFRRGRERVIVVSKVANFAIDLPEASVAIQLSGAFGSRQEEAQRLGRILRPKKRNSWFYSLVSRATVEEEFAAKRQRFLSEQGYRYTLDIWGEAG